MTSINKSLSSTQPKVGYLQEALHSFRLDPYSIHDPLPECISCGTTLPKLYLDEIRLAIVCPLSLAWVAASTCLTTTQTPPRCSVKQCCLFRLPCICIAHCEVRRNGHNQRFVKTAFWTILHCAGLTFHAPALDCVTGLQTLQPLA